MIDEMIGAINDLRRRLQLVEAVEVPKYAEGSWIPLYYGSVSAGTTTHAIQVGNYTRIGNVVTFSAYVSWTAATGTGDAYITLPFVSNSATHRRHTCAIWSYATTYPGGPTMGLIMPGTGHIWLWSPTSNTGGATIAVEASGEYVISGSYTV